MKPQFPFLALGLAALSIAACSGIGFSGNGGDGPAQSPEGSAHDTAADAGVDDGGDAAVVVVNPFVGTWSCSGTETTTFTAPSGTPASTRTTEAIVLIVADEQGNITADRMPVDAGPPCTLRSRLNPDGTSSMLTPGQMCISTNGGMVTYTSGSAAMDGPNAYSNTSAWTYDGETVKGTPLIGTGTGSGACTRM
jgi:hypothetical protein